MANTNDLGLLAKRPGGHRSRWNLLHRYRGRGGIHPIEFKVNRYAIAPAI